MAYKMAVNGKHLKNNDPCWAIIIMHKNTSSVATSSLMLPCANLNGLHFVYTLGTYNN